jgi:hypothetical protein
MRPRVRLGTCSIALALVVALPAHADPAAAPTTPQDEPAAAEPAPSSEEDTVTQEIAVTSVEPAASPVEPIEAVHRPGEPWTPVAVAADLLVMRPIGFVSLFAGAAAFVAVSPVAAAIGTLGDQVDTLRDRARNVFTRPVGAL